MFSKLQKYREDFTFYIENFWEQNGTLVRYSQYVNKRWLEFYFDYDLMKEQLLKIIKNKDTHAVDEIFLQYYDQDFREEIERVNLFLEVLVGDISIDIQKILASWKGVDQGTFRRKLSKGKVESADHAGIEHSLRSIYQRCEEAMKFLQLNDFLILKIAKKLVKSLNKKIRNSSIVVPLSDSKESVHDPNFDLWRTKFSSFKSYQHFEEKKNVIRHLRAKCIQEYRSIFRRVFPSLAQPELQFVKIRDTEEQWAKEQICIKVGLSLALILWLIVDSSKAYQGNEFWRRPGIYLYSSIGCLVLFKFAWSVNVWAWTKYNVDYASLLQYTDRNQMVFSEMNRASTLIVLFVGCVLLYQITAGDRSVRFETYSMEYLSPLILFIFFICYYLIDEYNRHSKQLSSLFINRMYPQFILCLIGYVAEPITLRDTYAADVLTSFTKVINDSVYASCWLVSGSFLKRDTTNDDHNSLKDFGNGNIQCTSFNMSIIAGCLTVLPLMIRFGQCIWFIRQQGLFFPAKPPAPPRQMDESVFECLKPSRYYPGLHVQVWNAGKYLFSMLVVLVGLAKPKPPYDKYYYGLIAFTTIYKTYWDVVKDWGLCLDPMADIRNYIARIRVQRLQQAIDRGASTDIANFRSNSRAASRAFSHANSMASNKSFSSGLATGDPSIPNLKPASILRTASTAQVRTNMSDRDRSDSMVDVADTTPIYTPVFQPDRVPAPFLRKSLMYPNKPFYYIAIFLNFILRFLWVVSLVPMVASGALGFYTPALSICLGAMEILRRALWGHFKMELEHIKMVEKGQSFFLQFHDVEEELSTRGKSATKKKFKKTQQEEKEKQEKKKLAREKKRQQRKERERQKEMTRLTEVEEGEGEGGGEEGLSTHSIDIDFENDSGKFTSHSSTSSTSDSPSSTPYSSTKSGESELSSPTPSLSASASSDPDQPQPQSSPFPSDPREAYQRLAGGIDRKMKKKTHSSPSPSPYSLTSTTSTTSLQPFSSGGRRMRDERDDDDDDENRPSEIDNPLHVSSSPPPSHDDLYLSCSVEDPSQYLSRPLPLPLPRPHSRLSPIIPSPISRTASSSSSSASSSGSRGNGVRGGMGGKTGRRMRSQSEDTEELEEEEDEEDEEEEEEDFEDDWEIEEEEEEEGEGEREESTEGEREGDDLFGFEEERKEERKGGGRFSGSYRSSHTSLSTPLL